jgi:uncharacterized membrane protein
VLTTTANTIGWLERTDELTGIAALQSSSGDITGMLMAGVLLIVLGLVGVAIWQGQLSSVADQFLGSSETATQPTAEPTTDDADQTAPAREADVEAESEPAERSDEEVVVDILEDNEGRMKQARIVDATGWSKSKVSMLLSEMEDDGDISKLRVGRENIISLRGNEPDAAGSPFEDE